MHYQSNHLSVISVQAQIEGMEQHEQELLCFLDKTSSQKRTREYAFEYEQCAPVSTYFIAERFGVDKHHLLKLAASDTPPFKARKFSSKWRGQLHLIDPVSYVRFAISARAGEFSAKVEMIDIQDIDHTFCARLPDQTLVDAMHESYSKTKMKGAVPPVLVAQDYLCPGRYYLIDGQITFHAQKKYGKSKVLAYIVPGGPRFALLAGIAINKNQGRALRQDRGNLVDLAVHEVKRKNPVTGKLPVTSEVAEKYHVSAATINFNLKEELTEELPLEYQPLEKRRKILCENLVHFFPKLQQFDVLQCDPQFDIITKLVKSFARSTRLTKGRAALLLSGKKLTGSTQNKAVSKTPPTKRRGVKGGV